MKLRDSFGALGTRCHNELDISPFPTIDNGGKNGTNGEYQISINGSPNSRLWRMHPIPMVPIVCTSSPFVPMAIVIGAIKRKGTISDDGVSNDNGD